MARVTYYKLVSDTCRFSFCANWWRFYNFIYYNVWFIWFI